MSSQRKFARMSVTNNLQKKEEKNMYNRLSEANLLKNDSVTGGNISIKQDDEMSELSLKDGSVTGKSEISRSSFKSINMFSFFNTSKNVKQINERSSVKSENILKKEFTYSDFLKMVRTNDDKMYRLKYKIPEEFNAYFYLQRYPHFGTIEQFTFKRIVTLYRFYSEEAKTKYNLDDKYYRLKYQIPNSLDCNLYKIRYPELFIGNLLEDDNLSIYRFYTKEGKETNPLDLEYKRLELNIGDYFDIDVLFDRYSELKDFADSFNALDKEECFAFYDSIDREKFNLDDDYYRLYFKTPKEFISDIYFTRYSDVDEIVKLKKNQYYEVYHFFDKTGKENYKLDEVYYRLKYKTPETFDCQVYQERYPDVLETSDFQSVIKFYSENNTKYPLDKKYFEIKFGVSSDFVWDKYSEAFSDYIEDKDRLNEMGYIYSLYANEFHNSVDESIYDRYLVLKNDLSTIDLYLYSKLYLYMYQDIKKKDFIYNFCDWKIVYNDIYRRHMTGEELIGSNFINDMSLILQNSKYFKSEKDIRRYIKLREFIDLDYFKEPVICKKRKQNIEEKTYKIKKEIVMYNIVKKHKSQIKRDDIIVNKKELTDQNEETTARKKKVDPRLDKFTRDRNLTAPVPYIEKKRVRDNNEISKYIALSKVNLSKKSKKESKINEQEVDKAKDEESVEQLAYEEAVEQLADEETVEQLTDEEAVEQLADEEADVEENSISLNNNENTSKISDLINNLKNNKSNLETSNISEVISNIKLQYESP